MSTDNWYTQNPSLAAAIKAIVRAEDNLRLAVGADECSVYQCADLAARLTGVRMAIRKLSPAAPADV